ncbi:MAG: replicative DNA helicase [Phycisphaerae bacterium]|nr:replicative DNA helicase [Phycisphaerae bacterium]
MVTADSSQGAEPGRTTEPTGSAERVPPGDIQAEACVLGSMMLHAPCIDSVLQIVRADQFYRPAHQLVFGALVEMHDGGKPIDLVAVREELTRRKHLEQVGGVDYLVRLAEGVPNAANAEYYAAIVRDKALLRELITAGNEMIRESYDSRDAAQEVIDRAEQRVFDIRARNVDQSSATLDALITQVFETLEKTEGQAITGLASGYHELDELTSGFQSGDMVILAARPSMGKTSILLNMVEHAAVVDQRPVAFFSLEMSQEQVAQRLLAAHARFDLRQLRRGMIGDEAWVHLQNSAGPLYEAPVFVDDSPMLTVLELRAKCRRLKSQHDIEAVFLDYMQLMSYAGRADSRQQQISEISRGIKALGRELDIPIIVAAQLNRSPTDRPTHRPRMSDLRESGSLEQDADVVMLLHNEDYYHKGEDGYMPTNITELIVDKQRNGPTGVIKLTFLPRCTRFESLAPEHAQAPGGAPF